MSGLRSLIISICVVSAAAGAASAQLPPLVSQSQTMRNIPVTKDDRVQRKLAIAANQQRQLEIKRDMERPRPMDRLICGDVGYGKTELAIRAAFKAVDNGKQVAVLVPTTVLAEQHCRTFGQRLAEYPFVVECLSRFRSGAEQKRILARLAKGGVESCEIP